MLVLVVLAPVSAAAQKGAGVVEAPIVGGAPVRISEHRWQVRLEHRSKGFVCGGSILKNTWVLTAHHCAGFLATDLDVVAGTNRIDASPQRVPVAEIVLHPAAAAVGVITKNDLALLRLRWHLEYNSEVGPIGVATEEHVQDGLMPPGTVGFTTGFGRLIGRGPYPTTLQGAGLEILDSPLTIGSSPITADMLVTGPVASGTGSTCNGDSGGPFTIPNPGGGRLLVGVTSWGPRSCVGPSIFASVPHASRWILDTLGEVGRGRSEYCEGRLCTVLEGDCDGPAECEDGLVCEANTGSRWGLRPETDVCHYPNGHEARCRSNRPCRTGEGPCRSSNDCERGLGCFLNVFGHFGLPETERVCLSPDALCSATSPCQPGGPCQHSGECVRGSTCDGGVCRPPTRQLCLPLRGCGLNEGPCSQGIDCEVGLRCLDDERRGYRTCQGTPRGPEVLDVRDL
jgi:hypothetical protein